MEDNARDNAILIVGPPGSGKGTQSAHLCTARPNIVYLESGALVREWVKQGSDLAKAYAPQLDQGVLLDDDQMFAVYKENRARMASNGDYIPGSSMLLADGYPRTVGQAIANTMLDVHGIIELRVDNPHVLVQRIQNDPKRAHRTDNDRETILRRIQFYNEKTEPMLDVYAMRGVPIHTYDASLDLETVQASVFAAYTSIEKTMSAASKR
ncbi:TPA: nucleoside monophosphate kinase [Candidatus Woesearchaeota archaeon]|nr:nucleoside monophosphate kinase [Candidatus Woesearchaeota archaeon]